MAGAPLYINPDYVVSLRPDPANPDEVTVAKTRDGESGRVRGEHSEVARTLMETAAYRSLG